MMLPIVSITMVTWNSSATLKACLDALLNQTFTRLEIIVVDNNSSDETLDILRAYPELKIFRQNANLGFCKGQNIAITRAKGKYILPLNPDVVMTETYVDNLVNVAERHPQTGMVTGKLLLSKSEESSETTTLIDSTGLFLKKTRRQFLRGHQEAEFGVYDRQEYVFGACGAAPLYRRAMLEACKFNGQYFDEMFFAYKEDVDLSWRAQLLGWKIIYTPKAVAFHIRTFKPGQRSGISKDIRMHAVKNRYLLLIKNELLSTFIRHVWHILFYDLKILVYLLLFERSSFKGLFKVITLLPQALRWRRFIMSHKKVNRRYVLAWIK